ncbi:hypothetical protein CCP2SC5_1760003 [Azospirillaceae bacterium]
MVTEDSDDSATTVIEFVELAEVMVISGGPAWSDKDKL